MKPAVALDEDSRGRADRWSAPEPIFAASRAAASSAKLTPRGRKDTVSRISITRSTVRCGRAGMRLTLASPTDQFGQGLATRRGSQYSHGVIRIFGLISVNMYVKG